MEAFEYMEKCGASCIRQYCGPKVQDEMEGIKAVWGVDDLSRNVNKCATKELVHEEVLQSVACGWCFMKENHAKERDNCRLKFESYYKLIEHWNDTTNNYNTGYVRRIKHLLVVLWRGTWFGWTNVFSASINMCNRGSNSYHSYCFKRGTLHIPKHIYC